MIRSFGVQAVAGVSAGVTFLLAVWYPVMLVQAQTQIGQSPKQALSPEMYRAMKMDSDKLDTVIRQQETFSYQHTKMMEKIDSLVPTINRNTEHLVALDQRVDAERAARMELEVRMDKHELSQIGQPTNIAVLTTQLNSVIEGQKQDRAVATWILTGVGGLILGLLGVLGKSILTKGIPPQWATEQSTLVASRLQEHEKKQDEYRVHVVNSLEEVKGAAQDAYREANTVNQKLAAIGVEVRDGKPLGKE